MRDSYGQKRQKQAAKILFWKKMGAGDRTESHTC